MGSGGSSESGTIVTRVLRPRLVAVPAAVPAQTPTQQQMTMQMMMGITQQMIMAAIVPPTIAPIGTV